MDYNKYRYELQKKKREQQKKSIANMVDLKELKMGYNIDVRLKAAWKFLNHGDKVKIIVNLKGRENEFRNNASELIRHFQNDVGESYNRDLFLFLYFLIIIVSTITSFKIHYDKSPILGKSMLYLNRHQTEEWKGWMQECQIMQLAWRLQMHQAHLRCMNQIRLLQLLLLVCCCYRPCG
ncbi:hypothetical protein LOK49_LG10G01172 [Camellia lanceoleosa]|uniref:Uncharacterized protein n=1 Tax=Camellia lanceoleosa TaxID=1840588 RepID=A0ACC0GDY3_9ERIC|nr:hypothetical protein LOK49_LG10G01172 [Camellia lanceoleosa]